MSALLFIVNTLMSLALTVVLVRLLLQLARADFRNQVAQAVVKLTNPLILPLRRILPPMGKVDTASVIAVVLIAVLKVAIVSGLSGLELPGAVVWLRAVAFEIVRSTLWTYFYAIFLYALLSMIAPGGYSPLQSLLASLCEPVLRPFRRLIPPISGIDLSPLWAGIAIQALLILLA
jgi:YggT family protein